MATRTGFTQTVIKIWQGFYLFLTPSKTKTSHCIDFLIPDLQLVTATAEVFSLPNATEAPATARVARESQAFAAISVPEASPDSSLTASLATSALETGTALSKTWPPAPETWYAAAKTST